MKRREVLKLELTSLAAFAVGFYSHGIMIGERAEGVEGRRFIEIDDLDPWNYNQGYVERLDQLLNLMGVNEREYFLIPANRDDIDALEHYNPTTLRTAFYPQDTKSNEFKEVAYKVFDMIEYKGYMLSTCKKLFA